MLFGKEKEAKQKMSYSQIIESLDILVEYPELMEYIKHFDSPAGFMYTIETDTQRKAYEKRLGELLDSNCNHSGGSWGCMLRGVQAVLNGVWTREQVIEQNEADDKRMQEWRKQCEERDKIAQQQEAEQQEAQQQHAARSSQV